MNRLTGITFTNSGVWTAPAGVDRVILTGRGGSGGGAGYQAGLANGGCGCFMTTQTVAVVPGTTYTITIGAGGLGAVFDGVVGAAGGDTSFDSLCTFLGGNGGLNAAKTDPVLGSYGPTFGGGSPLFYKTDAAQGSPFISESVATSGGAGDGSGGILAAFSGQLDCNGTSGGGGGASSVTLIPAGNGTSGILNIFWVE